MDRNDSGAGSPVSLDDLVDQISELAGHLNAADRRWLSLIAEFDRREGWSSSGARSCAHWLNWKCGLDLGAAREKLRVAHALEALPSIGAAMGRGELSYSKVRALTRVATRETEDYLLSIALAGTAEHVERLVRAYRRFREAEALSAEARQQAGRAVHFFTDEDGSLVIRARLPAETGALIMKAVEAVIRQQDEEAASAVDPVMKNVSAETSSTGRMPLSQRRADALGALAESFLAHGPAALAGGERQQIVVHVDAATLAARDAEEATTPRCELEDGPAIPAETARRLACDASVVTLVEDTNGNPLDVGRRTRSIPPALRRTLKSRDKGCRFPGCTHQRYVDGHHVQHWAHGGATKLGNLISLCRFHHRLVHEGGVRIEALADAQWSFHLPNGDVLETAAGMPRPRAAVMASGEDGSARHPNCPHAPASLNDHERCSAIIAANTAQSIRITPQTAVSRWRGESMDYGIAMEALDQRARRAGSTSSRARTLRRVRDSSRRRLSKPCAAAAAEGHCRAFTGAWS